MFILIIGLFNTWFFVVRIPKDLEKLEEITTYPKGLRIFTQYVLLPLIILYLIILYGYGAKILIEGDWPKGIVSYLISGVSVFGIFAMLLIYPYRVEKDKGWIGKFSTWYYYLLLPLIVLLFIAVGMRIADYGITINRYVLVVLGIWLTLVSLYFSLGKSNIKIIPVLLTIFLGLSSFGPWGMSSVSEKSQINRLENILSENGILKEGKIQNKVIWIKDSMPKLNSLNEETNEKLLPDSVHNEVYSIINYLDKYHGLEGVRSWFSQDLDSLATIRKDSFKYESEISLYMQSMGLKHQFIYNINEPDHIYFHTQKSSYLNVKNFDYLVQNKRLNFQGKWNSKTRKMGPRNWRDSSTFRIKKQKFTLKMDSVNLLLVLSDQGEDLHFDFGKLLEYSMKRYKKDDYSRNIKKNEMTLTDSNELYKIEVLISNFRLEGDLDSNYVTNINYDVFIKDK